MEEGDPAKTEAGDSQSGNPVGAPDGGEAPGSAKACLRHQEDSPAKAAQQEDGVIPSNVSGSSGKSPDSERSVGNGAVEGEEGKEAQTKQGKQESKRRKSKRTRKKSAATKNGQMTDVRKDSQEDNSNQGSGKSKTIDDDTKDVASKHDATVDDTVTSLNAAGNEAMTEPSSGGETPKRETTPTPKQKSVQVPTLQAALGKNVKMGRDDAGSMMSELLMRMARDHEEKNSRKEKRDTPGPAGSPTSSASNIGSPGASSDDTGGRMLLTLLQQQPEIRRNKPQSRGKASPALDDDSRHHSPHQWASATGSPSSATAGDNDLTSVISNVDRSGSFLMQLLTTNQQFAGARDMKTQEQHPMLAISSTKSLRGTDAEEAFTAAEGNPKSPEEHDPEHEEESSVLVIQPEPSGDNDGNVFKCPICGARFDNSEDRSFHFQFDHQDLELVDEDSSQQEYIALEELKALATPKPATRTRKRKASHTRKVVENVDLMEEGENYESPIAKRSSSQDSFRPEQLQVSSPKLTGDDEDIGFVQGYLCKTCGMLRKSLEELREHKAAAHPELLDNVTKRKTPDIEPQKRTAVSSEGRNRNKFALETCLICGKSSRDVTLKNIYRTADRYDMTLTRLLERTVQESVGHSKFICVVCKRQVRKLEMAKKKKVPTATLR